MAGSSLANVLLELVVGLSAQVVPVDQEEDPLGPGEFYQPIDERHGRKGLARAGRHLDQGTGVVSGK